MKDSPIQELLENMEKRNRQKAREKQQNIPLDEPDCHLQINPIALCQEVREIKIEKSNWDLQDAETEQIEETGQGSEYTVEEQEENSYFDESDYQSTTSKLETPKILKNKQKTSH